jgi:hypothetical protein
MGGLGKDFGDVATPAVEYAEALSGFYRHVAGGRTTDLTHAEDHIKSDARVVAGVLKRNDGKLPEGYEEDPLIAAAAAQVLAHPAEFGLSTRNAAVASSPRSPRA